MLRALPILAALPLLVAFGIAEGLWSNRWATSRDVEQAAARLGSIALTVDDWDGAAAELDARQLQIGEIKGHLVRRYVHRPTGTPLTVLIVCGEPGPISVHTPDVCYGGAGYRMTGPPVKSAVETTPSAEFWMARFIKAEAVAPEPLRILWAWNDGQGWTAADSPRLQFARSRALYKLYVVRPLSGPEEASDKDLSLAFLRRFLPEVEQALFSKSETAPARTTNPS